ncbi:MAG: hypothetical protein FJ009_00090 [Chloroflexi bacterium]|nr:hypothetical protein [Chloroflexota bacterium]
MNRAIARIPVDELVENPTRVLKRVTRERRPVALERRGKVLVLLTPFRARLPHHRKNRTADRNAFLAAAGSWKAKDTDALS